MNRFVPVLLAAISAIAISACAYNSRNDMLNQQADASHALNRGFDKDESRGDLFDAESAAARGDWSVSAALAEKSYREAPDLVNEFNLATAYQRTGRGELAVPLYIDLVDRGQFTRTASILNFDGSWPSPMLPFISQEAARRLERMGLDAGIPATNAKFPVVAAQ